MPDPIESRLIVLSGKTGSGKSAILRFLASQKYPVIDLEKIALHRGSVFGSAGLHLPQPSQQTFDKQLKESFNAYHLKPFVFTEQKPSSIGKRKLPNWFREKIDEGLNVELHVPKIIRAKNILKEYFDTEEKRQAIFFALNKLSERFSEEKILMLQDFILKKNYETFVDSMLEYYDYSSRYQSENKKPFIEIFVKDEFDIENISHEIIETLSKEGVIVF